MINLIMKLCIKFNRVLYITGTGVDTDVYLIRYIIARNKLFSIYIHQFLRSDRDDLHDHPWNFCTFLVKGAYTEEKYNSKVNIIETTRRTTTQNRFVFRKATDLHRVVVDHTLKIEEKDKAALTLFFGGPIIKEWGFVRDCLGKHEWVPWRKYLGLPDDHPSR